MKVETTTTLLVFLLEKSAAATKTAAKQLVRQGRVHVDGLLATNWDQPLKKGQDVAVSRRSALLPAIRRQAKHTHFPLVYEDRYIVAAVKPAGMLALPSKEQRGGDFYSLMRLQLTSRKENPTDLHYVHGLDGPVSGIVVFAKNETTKNTLRLTWRKAVRRYAVLVQGEMEQPQGIISEPLEGDKAKGKSRRMPEILPTTRYKVLKSFETHSLLEVEPLAELKMQMRKHLAHSLHPILGDRLHGAKTNPLGRLAVHLFHVSFAHPATKETIKITVPIPSEFTQGGKNRPQK
jgi:23S rRNA pseudouridine1911/1915/1917 synthase